MKAEEKAELESLITLEAAGTLEDSQKSRLIELRKIAQEAKDKDFQSALAQKEHFRMKAEKAESDKKILEEKLNARPNSSNQTLDVGDFMDISTALEGLDQKEKEYLTRNHKLSGLPLGEIRKDEDFLLWQSAHRQKVEKEKTLAPSSKQPDIDAPVTLEQALKEAKSPQEKEQLLKDAGLYTERGQRADRVNRR